MIEAVKTLREIIQLGEWKLGGEKKREGNGDGKEGSWYSLCLGSQTSELLWTRHRRGGKKMNARSEEGTEGTWQVIQTNRPNVKFAEHGS